MVWYAATKYKKSSSTGPCGEQQAHTYAELTGYRHSSVFFLMYPNSPKTDDGERKKKSLNLKCSSVKYCIASKIVCSLRSCQALQLFKGPAEIESWS